MTSPDGTPRTATDLVASMGWVQLPYDCVGLLRRSAVGDHALWSWLILVPWAVNDSKPWIDGTELIERPSMSHEAQTEFVLSKLREILDDRYAESGVAGAADEFLRNLSAGDG